MQSVTATFRNGRLELAESVDWPEGTRVEVKPLAPPGQERNRGEPPRTQWRRVNNWAGPLGGR